MRPEDPKIFDPNLGKIHKIKVSAAKIKLYQYDFTLAAKKCGIKSVDEFLDVVYAAQVHFSDEDWLQQVYDVGCGHVNSDRSNAHERDGAKAKLLDSWRTTLSATSSSTATTPTIVK